MSGWLCHGQAYTQLKQQGVARRHYKGEKQRDTDLPHNEPGLQMPMIASVYEPIGHACPGLQHATTNVCLAPPQKGKMVYYSNNIQTLSALGREAL